MTRSVTPACSISGAWLPHAVGCPTELGVVETGGGEPTRAACKWRFGFLTGTTGIAQGFCDSSWGATRADPSSARDPLAFLPALSLGSGSRVPWEVVGA